MGLQTDEFQDKEERLSTVNLNVFKVINLVSRNHTEAPVTTYSSKIHMYSEAAIGGSGERRNRRFEGFAFPGAIKKAKLVKFNKIEIFL